MKKRVLVSTALFVLLFALLAPCAAWAQTASYYVSATGDYPVGMHFYQGERT